MVGEDLVAPTPQGLREYPQLGSGGRVAAPVDRPLERCLGFGRGVGEVDVADVLFGDPGVSDAAVGVAVAWRLVEAFPSVLVEVLGSISSSLRIR